MKKASTWEKTLAIKLGFIDEPRRHLYSSCFLAYSGTSDAACRPIKADSIGTPTDKIGNVAIARDVSELLATPLCLFQFLSQVKLRPA